MTGRHIFIVGLPRTGTTLMRAILNASPEIGIGGESKFFPDRSLRGGESSRGFYDRFRDAGDLSTDHGIARIADVVYSQSARNYWSRLADGMERAEFEARLRASDRTPRALFDVAMEHFSRGRPVRGDKTPQHIYWVPLLLAWFPEARIIHTFRDPRAVHESLIGKAARNERERTGRVSRRPAGGLLAATSLIVRWRRVITLHRQYESTFAGRYILLRFEDLIAEPRASVQRVCSHVGVDFSDHLLDQMMLNSSFVAHGSSRGFDPAVLERWREHMSPLTRRWFATLCRRELETFGYAP